MIVDRIDVVVPMEKLLLCLFLSAMTSVGSAVAVHFLMIVEYVPTLLLFSILFFIVVVVVALMIPYKLVQRRQPFTTLWIQQRFADKLGDVKNVCDPPPS